MEYWETIIIGGGPAGSSCAHSLNQAGRQVLILDKTPFPRLKLCAGWITSNVLRDLNITPTDYPHSILKLTTRLHIAPVPFALMPWPTRWTDYSIRRIEFDHWLLQRAGVPVKIHQVNHIEVQDNQYVLDGQWACRYLVGAGGTGCPVRHQLFPNQRKADKQILALEKEFYYPQRATIAHFFFFARGILGYSWYIPKGNGYLNIGLGGFGSYFKHSPLSIHDHFHYFLKDLAKLNLLDAEVGETVKPAGYAYYLSDGYPKETHPNCFLIGDSAGVSTLDFAEGIGPSIKSGQMAARAILGQGTYAPETILKRSIRPGLQWMRPMFLTALRRSKSGFASSFQVHS